MPDHSARRRRSPWWIREMTALSLHRLGGKLLNDFRTDGLSPAQDALYDSILSELAYRNRRQVVADRCTCLLCCEPFPDDLEV